MLGRQSMTMHARNDILFLFSSHTHTATTYPVLVDMLLGHDLLGSSRSSKHQDFQTCQSEGVPLLRTLPAIHVLSYSNMPFPVCDLSPPGASVCVILWVEWGKREK